MREGGGSRGTPASRRRAAGPPTTKPAEFATPQWKTGSTLRKRTPDRMPRPASANLELRYSTSLLLGPLGPLRGLRVTDAPPPAGARGRGSRQGEKMVHDPGKQVGGVFGRLAQPLAPGSLGFRNIVVARLPRQIGRQQAAPGDAPGVAARIEKGPKLPEL